MKIVLIIEDLLVGKGGAERVGAELANEMVNRGHNIYVVSKSKNEEHTLSYPLDPKVNHIISPFSHLKRVEKIIRDINPDVYFFFNIGTNVINFSKIAYNIGIPYTFQECTNPVRAVNNVAKLPKMSSLEEAYQIRQAFIAGAARIRLVMKSYINFSPMIAKKNCVAFNNAFKKCNKKASLQSKQMKRIICVNGLKCFNKNGLLLANAFVRLEKNFPNWQLDFYGAIHSDISPFLQNFEGHKIHFHGLTDDIYEAYSASQIHVICSFEEGNPNVVCEAMLHGLPSIGFSDCMGTNELIKHNENGLLIDRTEQDISALVKALSLLMRDNQLRSKLGKQAFQDSKMFKSKITYDTWEKFFIDAASYKNNPQRVYQNQKKIDPIKATFYQKVRQDAWEKYGY